MCTYVSNTVRKTYVHKNNVKLVFFSIDLLSNTSGNAYEEDEI